MIRINSSAARIFCGGSVQNFDTLSCSQLWKASSYLDLGNLLLFGFKGKPKLDKLIIWGPRSNFKVFGPPTVATASFRRLLQTSPERVPSNQGTQTKVHGPVWKTGKPSKRPTRTTSNSSSK